ncbi:hypothetical protein DL93DRAFT_2088400 [Clavulina sp. PMI_390]|nr:hypothetical protein DL93DRAFT_2088400 [Clavulina sp. PMI_390]
MAKHLSVPVLPPTGPATGLESGPSHPRLSSHVTDATISPSTAQNGCVTTFDCANFAPALSCSLGVQSPTQYNSL